MGVTKDLARLPLLLERTKKARALLISQEVNESVANEYGMGRHTTQLETFFIDFRTVPS